MKPTISVIVPVYNTQNYLCRCIDSILTQTYSNLEIILVDDGSTDKSPAICDEYTKKNECIKVYHKKNGGVSSARNVGLDMATGMYVCFVDSDDVLPRKSVEYLFRAVVSGECQYATGVCRILGSQRVKNDIAEDRVITRQESDFLRYIVSDGSYSPYAKIYNLALINEKNIRFREDMQIAEDTVFIREYLKYCNKIALVANVVYDYNPDNNGSLSKKAYSDYSKLYGEKMKGLAELVDSLTLTTAEKELFLTERAINGIQISINHYFSHWKSEKDRITFLAFTAKCLLPWVSLEDAVRDSTLKIWWKRYGVDLKKGNYRKICRKMSIKYFVREVRSIIGAWMRKNIKAIVS